MVSRSFEIYVENEYNGNEEVFSIRPNSRRFEFFKEDIFNRRPDLKYQPMRIYYQSFSWVKSSDRVGIPQDAVIAGRDLDGATIYAGRAFYSGHYIPAKVIPSKRIAYVPWQGCEHSSRDYEFLCGTRFDWVKSSNGNVPPGAVCTGKQVDGMPLYVGRANIGGSLAVGKVHKRYNCIYVPFAGREHSNSHYEVLVERKQGLSWTKVDESYGYPVDGIVAGYDTDGSTIYVGRSYHSGHYIPAKVIPSKRVAYVSWGGHEHAKRDYEFLCGTAFQWMKCSNGYIPSKAVIAGREQGVALYVGRANIGGSMAVGKFHDRYKCFYVPYDGTERSMQNYEVLVELESTFGGSNVYIHDEVDFCTFLNQNINKVFIEKSKEATSATTSAYSYSYSHSPQPSSYSYSPQPSSYSYSPQPSSYSHSPQPSSYSYSPQPSSRVRHNVTCTGCSDEIYDIRYKCIECRDVNLCMKCEPTIHRQHLMVRIINPNDEPIVTEKAAPTSHARRARIDEAEVKETRRRIQLDTDLRTEFVKLGLAGMNILLNDTIKESKEQPEVRNNVRPQATSHPTASQATPSAPPMPDPVQLHPDARVNNGLITLLAMGFDNEQGWLVRLLESVDGNIGKALDLIQNKQ